MTTSPLAPADLQEPPPDPRRVLVVGLVGVGLVVAAFVIGLATDAPKRGFDTHAQDGPRAALCAVGLLLAGCAVSMRPAWVGGWLCVVVAGILGYGFGPPPPVGTEWQVAPPRNWYAAMPNSWDSLQLFFGVAALAGLVGALWGWLPRRVALGLILAGVAFHFAGILSAITSPPPTPWISSQYWHRVARPYLQFAYMNNAYQFYSPDPGPATELWVCIEYRPAGADDDPTAEKHCEWLHLPRRKEHYIDPLGLSYYRRLSLTENVAQYQAPGYVPLAAEQYQVLARRARVAQDSHNPIPRKPGWTDDQERRPPNELVTRHVLPSYARHLAAAHARPGWEVTSIKIYRTLHLIVQLAEFRGFDGTAGRSAAPVGPFYPPYYLPYFQGEFRPDGTLVDPTAPMLYWLVPIVQEKQPPESRDEYRRQGGLKHYFKDYVSVHAGCERPAEEGP